MNECLINYREIICVDGCYIDMNGNRNRNEGGDAFLMERNLKMNMERRGKFENDKEMIFCWTKKLKLCKLRERQRFFENKLPI
jgi:hypothetical protein